MPQAPEPNEVRQHGGVKGKPPEEVQGYWRQRGYEQLSMFQPGSTTVNEIVVGTPPPSQRHSRTSRAAALLVDHGERSKKLARIYNLLLSRLPGGLTDEEGQDILGVNGNTYRPRRGELLRARLVVDSKSTRPTRSLRQAVVWKAVPVEDV